MINCNENENDDGNTDNINKTDQDVNIETNIQKRSVSGVSRYDNDFM